MAQSRKLPVRDTHPPVENRLYLVGLTCEVLGLHDKTYVGNAFHKIVREFCVLLDVDERVPPLLSRELNRIAVQVYDDLGIDYSHAKYVFEFT